MNAMIIAGRAGGESPPPEGLMDGSLSQLQTLHLNWSQRHK